MSTWYPYFLQNCFTRGPNTSLTGTIMVQLLSSSYAYNQNDRFLSDIPAGKRISQPQQGTGPSFTTGSFSMTGSTFPSLTGGAVGGLAVYLSSSVEASSSLVMYINNAAVFPLSASGVDQSLVWTTQPLCDTTSSKRWYPKFAESLLAWPANSDVSGGTVKTVLLSSSYTPAAGDTFLSDLPANSMQGLPQTLGSKTFTSGTFDAADVTFPLLTGTLSTASVLNAIAVYIDTGTNTTSRLMLYLGSGQGLPLTPNGQNQPVNWNPSGIAPLGATA